MPREVPRVSTMAPLRARARRWSSAALAERNPNDCAISARVGGKPVRWISERMRSRTCCWLWVSLTDIAVFNWVYIQPALSVRNLEKARAVVRAPPYYAPGHGREPPCLAPGISRGL